MKRILVATDLSERSDRAIDRAIILARKFGARLTVLHVIDEDLPASVADRQKEAASANLQEHLSTLSNAKALEVEPVVTFGKDWTEILRRAEDDGSELIVLGTHRERGLGGLLRGTTVERVIRNGNIPVLVAKNRATRDYGSIVVGVDFSVYSGAAVEFGLRFASDAKVCLVHAYEVPFKAFLSGASTHGEIKKAHEEQFSHMVGQEMAGFLARLGTPPPEEPIERVMREGGPHEVIHEEVAKLGAELLILGTHGRTGVSHAFLGSVAEEFLNDPPCDVVTVKAW